MKEYRVICTLETENRAGQKMKIDPAVYIAKSGHKINNIFSTYAEAVSGLEYIKIRADRKNAESLENWKTESSNARLYKYSNFRIQERTVTEWI